MKFVRWLVALFLISALVAGGVAVWLYSSLHRPVSHNMANEYITIEKGMASYRILDILEDQQIIQAPFATKIYLYLFKKDVQLEAGDYRFPSPISPLAAL